MSPNSNGLPFTAEQLQQFAAKGRFFYTPGNTSMPDLTSSTWRDDCLRQQQDVMVKAEEATLKRPLAEIPARSQQEVVKEAHKQRAEVLKEMKEGKTVEPIVMGYKRPFSTTPLSDLTPIQINDMRVTQTHKGRYLVGRIVSQPWGAASIRFALEDTKGRAEICEIRYFPLTNIVTGPDLDRILPLGTILFVREPTFRIELSLSKAALPLISVNSPTDVVFLRPDHPRLENITWSSPSPAPSPPRPIDFQALGDSLADEGKLQLAVKAYSDGLFTDLDSKEKLVLQLSRAKVQLRLNNFASAARGAASAIRMVDEGVEGGPGMMSGAVLVMAKGYEGLRLFSKAESSYRRYLQLIPASSPRAKEGKEGQQRMKSALSGTAPIKFLSTEIGELHDWKAWTRGYDLADWFGPVAIAQLPGREGGRGIVATRDIKPGELLLVEKAFAWGSRKEYPDNVRFDGHDLPVRHGASGSLVRLVTNLVNRLVDDPSSAPLVNALYGGPDHLSNVTPSLDQLAQRSFDVEETPAQPDLDIDRLEAICSFNRFALHQGDESEEGQREGAAGLFLATSIFNHHCVPSTQHTFHRDIGVVRARTSIKKGEEIFISYSPIGHKRAKRQEFFRPVFKDGLCPCEICRLDRLDGAEKVTLRHKILEEEYSPIRRGVESAGSLLSEAEGQKILSKIVPLIARLESTYSPSRGPLRPDLSDIYHFLAALNVPAQPSKRAEIIALRIKAFEAAGAIFEKKGTKVKVIAAPILTQPHLQPVPLCLLASCTYLQLFPKDLPSALSWMQAAVDIDRLMRGGSYASVRGTYSKAIKELNIGYLLDEAEKLSLKKKK